MDIFFGCFCYDKWFIMKFVYVVIFLGILFNYILIVFCCFLFDGWLLLRFRVWVKKVDIVIYGIVRVSCRWGFKKDYEGLYSVFFEVYCIFKGGIVF